MTNHVEGVDPFLAKVYVQSESMKMDVFVEPAENGNLLIRFLDSKGRTLATKRGSENANGVRFDVSDLKEGRTWWKSQMIQPGRWRELK